MMIKKFQAEIAQRRADGWVRFSRESQSKDDGKSGQVVWYDNKQYVLVADAEKSRRLTDCATNDDGVCVWFWSGWAKPAENAVA